MPKLKDLKNITIIIIFTIIWGFSVFSLNAKEQILVIVNQEAITTKDFNDFLNFMRIQFSADEKNKTEEEVEEKLKYIKDDLLQKLIEDKLILQEAKKQKINIDKNIIQKRIESIRKHYPTDTEFQEALYRQGLTLSDIEKKIEEQLLIYNAIDKNVKSRISIHPQEITAFYESHYQDFIEPEKRDILIFILDDYKKAQDAYAQINGQSQPDALEKLSLKTKELKDIERGQLKKEFDEIVFALAENCPSQIIASDDKYYIFWVKKITPAQNKSLAEVKQEIYDMLFEKKMQDNLKNWLDELRKKSYIEIKEN